jgi:hypothetical protein
MTRLDESIVLSAITIHQVKWGTNWCLINTFLWHPALGHVLTQRAVFMHNQDTLFGYLSEHLAITMLWSGRL